MEVVIQIRQSASAPAQYLRVLKEEADRLQKANKGGTIATLDIAMVRGRATRQDYENAQLREELEKNRMWQDKHTFSTLPVDKQIEICDEILYFHRNKLDKFTQRSLFDYRCRYDSYKSLIFLDAMDYLGFGKSHKDFALPLQLVNINDWCEICAKASSVDCLEHKDHEFFLEIPKQKQRFDGLYEIFKQICNVRYVPLYVQAYVKKLHQHTSWDIEGHAFGRYMDALAIDPNSAPYGDSHLTQYIMDAEDNWCFGCHFPIKICACATPTSGLEFQTTHYTRIREQCDDKQYDIKELRNRERNLRKQESKLQSQIKKQKNFMQRALEQEKMKRKKNRIVPQHFFSPIANFAKNLLVAPENLNNVTTSAMDVINQLKEKFGTLSQKLRNIDPEKTTMILCSCYSLLSAIQDRKVDLILAQGTVFAMSVGMKWTDLLSIFMSWVTVPAARQSQYSIEPQGFFSENVFSNSIDTIKITCGTLLTTISGILSGFKDMNQIITRVSSALSQFGRASVGFKSLMGLGNWLVASIQDIYYRVTVGKSLEQVKMERAYPEIANQLAIADIFMSPDCSMSYFNKSKKLCEMFRSNISILQQLHRASVAMQDKKIAAIIAMRLASMTKRLDEVNRSSAGVTKARNEPFNLFIYGASGVGKSVLAKALQRCIYRDYVLDKETWPFENAWYYRNAEQEFWDGYMEQPCVFIDDIYQKVDSSTNPNLEYFETIRMINDAPTPLHMAEINDKKNTYFRSDFVVATSNIKIPTPNSTISTDAVRRRWTNAVEMRVNSRYRVSDTDHKLDIKKITPGSFSTEPYEFRFYNMCANTTTSSWMNYSAFIEKVKNLIETHQSRVVSMTADIDMFASVNSGKIDDGVREFTDRVSKLAAQNEPQESDNEFWRGTEWFTGDDVQDDVLIEQFVAPYSPDEIVQELQSCEGGSDDEIIEYTENGLDHQCEITPEIVEDAFANDSMFDSLCNHLTQVHDKAHKFGVLMKDKISEKISKWQTRLSGISKYYTAACCFIRDYLLGFLEFMARNVLWSFIGIATARMIINRKYNACDFGRFQNKEEFLQAQVCKNAEKCMFCVTMYRTEDFTSTTPAGSIEVGMRQLRRVFDHPDLFEKEYLAKCARVLCTMQSYEPQSNETRTRAAKHRYRPESKYTGESTNGEKFEALVPRYNTTEGRNKLISQHGDIIQMEQWSAVLKTNACRIESVNSSGNQTMQAVFLTGNIICFPHHLLDKIPDCEKQMNGDKHWTVKSDAHFLLWNPFQTDINTKILWKECNIFQAKTKYGTPVDVAFVELPKRIPSRRNIISKFHSAQQRILLQEGSLIVTGMEKIHNVLSLTEKDVVDFDFRENMSVYGDNYEYKTPSSVYYKINTKGGDCGSLIWCNNSLVAGKIIGFHVAGNGQEGIGLVLSKEFIERNMDDFSKSCNETSLIDAKIPYQPQSGHMCGNVLVGEFDKITTKKPILFKYNSENQVLSNLFMQDLIVEYKDTLLKFPSVEHAYQYTKVLSQNKYMSGSEFATFIKQTPHQVMRANLGKYCCDDMAVRSMLKFLYEKQKKNEFNPATYREDTKHPFWGGERNMMGKLWTSITANWNKADYRCKFNLEEKVPYSTHLTMSQEAMLPVNSLTHQGDCVSLGMVTSTKQPEKTTLTRSRVPELREPLTTPAPLKPVEVDGVWVDPLTRGIKKILNTQVVLDKQLLQIAVADVERVLFTTKPVDNGVLSYHEAVEGIDGDSYIGSLNRTSSPGYPYSLNNTGSGKYKWFGKDDKYKHSPEVKRDVDKLLNDARENRRGDVIYTATLKDERVNLEKASLGKTRVFCAAPMHYSIANRMYFLSFVKHIMQRRNHNEISVGTNPYGFDWHQIGELLCTKGPNVIAGDFSNFDGSLHAEILWEICEMICRWYQQVDKSATNNRIRRVLWEDIASARILYKGEIIQCTHSQPSGNPLTAIVNSIFNIIVMRMAYLQCKKENGGSLLCDFTQHVKMVAYGDDNVLNISPDVIPWFNQQTITTSLAKFGLTYTDEGKTGNIVACRRLDEIEFLKRKFIQDHEGYFLAPLRMEVITEMTMWIRGKRSWESSAENVATAMRELSLYPKATFQSIAGPWIEWFNKNKKRYFPDVLIYSWEEYREQLRSLRYSSDINGPFCEYGVNDRRWVVHEAPRYIEGEKPVLQF